jgi:T-complex protein 1 subunit theta
MDDIERAVDDGVNTFKALTKDGRLVPGGGAVEVEIASRISSFAETLPGMEQYAVGKFAEALQSLPSAIADNAGVKYNDIITMLLAAHAGGDRNACVDITTDTPAVTDAIKNQIYDLYVTKYWGIKYATSTAATILQVDQIICAKPAGGPKPRQGGGDWDQD